MSNVLQERKVVLHLFVFLDISIEKCIVIRSYCQRQNYKHVKAQQKQLTNFNDIYYITGKFGLLCLRTYT